MSKLNHYYGHPTISSIPDAGLVAVNKIKNLENKNKVLTSGIFVVISITISLFYYAAMNFDIKEKKKF